MDNTTPLILQEIEAFLAETGMGASYFGKVAVGNSELVGRLRSGNPVLNRTEDKVRGFIRSRRDAVTDATQ